MSTPYDSVGNIVAFEQGELDEEATIALFQHLIDTGLAWSLQGHYGRTAADCLRAGLCQATTSIARRIARER